MTPEQLGMEILMETAKRVLGNKEEGLVITEDIARMYFDSVSNDSFVEDAFGEEIGDSIMFRGENLVIANTDTLTEIGMRNIQYFVDENLRDNPLREFIDEDVLVTRIFDSPALEENFLPTIAANICNEVFLIEI